MLGNVKQCQPSTAAPMHLPRVVSFPNTVLHGTRFNHQSKTVNWSPHIRHNIDPLLNQSMAAESWVVSEVLLQHFHALGCFSTTALLQSHGLSVRYCCSTFTPLAASQPQHCCRVMVSQVLLQHFHALGCFSTTALLQSHGLSARYCCSTFTPLAAAWRAPLLRLLHDSRDRSSSTPAGSADSRSDRPGGGGVQQVVVRQQQDAVRTQCCVNVRDNGC
jgi:hypothetical protein